MNFAIYDIFVRPLILFFLLLIFQIPNNPGGLTQGWRKALASAEEGRCFFEFFLESTIEKWGRCYVLRSFAPASLCQTFQTPEPGELFVRGCSARCPKIRCSSRGKVYAQLGLSGDTTVQTMPTVQRISIKPTLWTTLVYGTFCHSKASTHISTLSTGLQDLKRQFRSYPNELNDLLEGAATPEPNTLVALFTKMTVSTPIGCWRP